MSTAANSGARIKRVEVTDERITAHLADGRVISVPLACHGGKVGHEVQDRTSQDR